MVRADALSPAEPDGAADIVAVVVRSVFAGGRWRVRLRTDPSDVALTADLTGPHAADLAPGDDVRLAIDRTETARVTPD